MTGKECYERPCAFKYSALQKGATRSVYTVFVGLLENAVRNVFTLSSEQSCCHGKHDTIPKYSLFVRTQHHTSFISSEEQC